MSNVHAAKAASTASSIPVRQLLEKVVGTISVTVPTRAHGGKFPSSDGGGRYLQFAQNVRGGVVNYFVHDDEPLKFYGKKIIADVEIWQKTLADGRAFLYVDLRPQQSTDTPPTHRLVVMSVKKEDLQLQDDFVAFETPAPLVGTIVVVPIDSKVIIKAPVVETENKVTNINSAAATEAATSPATSAMLEEFARKWNGNK
ncbi:MAG: hypothetical protein Q7R58_00490 [bacterium]|nr:hypothetical protein [bacterium]